MPDPVPLAAFFASLAFDQLRGFVAPRVPDLAWSLPVAELAHQAAEALITREVWFYLMEAMR